ISPAATRREAGAGRTAFASQRIGAAAGACPTSPGPSGARSGLADVVGPVPLAAPAGAGRSARPDRQGTARDSAGPRTGAFAQARSLGPPTGVGRHRPLLVAPGCLVRSQGAARSRRGVLRRVGRLALAQSGEIVRPRAAR